MYDAQGTALDLPPDGLVISTVLADRLAVRPGDTITVEVLEGRRPVLEIPVVATFETYIGRPAYIDIDALNRAMHEPPSVTAVHLRVDPLFETRLYRELKQMPQVSAVNLRSAAVTTFNETLAKTMLIYVGFFIVFSATLACGVAYNAARIALAERARELATMRVLGFSRREVEYILIGEIGLLTFVALPLGAGIGWLLARWLVRAFQTNSTSTVHRRGVDVQLGHPRRLLATLAPVLLVRRRLNRFDLHHHAQYPEMNYDTAGWPGSGSGYPLSSRSRACWHGSSTTTIAVDLATVARGPLQVSVSDDGETRVRDMFVVSAPLAGHMRRIELEAGGAAPPQARR